MDSQLSPQSNVVGPRHLLRGLLVFVTLGLVGYLCISESLLALAYEHQSAPVAHYASPWRQLAFGTFTYALAFAAFHCTRTSRRGLLVTLGLAPLLVLFILETTRQVSRSEVLLGPSNLHYFRHKSCGRLALSWGRLELGPNSTRFYLPLLVETDPLTRDVRQFDCEPKPFRQGRENG